MGAAPVQELVSHALLQALGTHTHTPAKSLLLTCCLFSGYGHPINWQMSCPLVSDIILQLSSTASHWEEQEDTYFPSPRTLIRLDEGESS